MRRHVLVATLAAVAFGGPIACGDDSPSTTTDGGSASRPGTTATKPTGRRGHNAEEYKGVYADTKELCGISPSRAKVAEIVGSKSTRPRDIARAVAKGYKPRLRRKAYNGCLAGLR
jgi:hypothetical protein